MGYAANRPKTEEELIKKGEYWKKRVFDHLIPAVRNLQKDVIDPAMHDLAWGGLFMDPIKQALAKYNQALNELGNAISSARLMTAEEALAKIDTGKIMTGNSHEVTGVAKEDHEPQN